MHCLEVLSVNGTTRSEEIREAVARHLAGENDVFHDLYCLPDDYGADMIRFCLAASDAEARALLLDVLWNRREPAAIPLLERMIEDENEDVWQAALDGLVTYGSIRSAEIIEEYTARLKREKPGSGKIDWMIEAFEQLRERLANDG